MGLWGDLGKVALAGQVDIAEGQATRGNGARATVQSGIPKLEFDRDTGFQKELRRRVDEYFQTTGRAQRGGWRMYVKTAFILTGLTASYVLLVFVAQSVWQGLLLATTLALFMAGVGFNIQHDGGHQAYSNRPWLNRLMACMLDLMGSSSARWRWKHTVIHHMYVNITGYDSDIDMGLLGRFSPHHRRYWWHRWQQFYLWLAYGLLSVKLQLVDDFRYVITGRLGELAVPRPRGWELVIFIAGKALFFAWALAIPMLLHPVWTVLFYFAVASVVLGTVMVLVFIIPHLVAKADFPLPRPDTGRMEKPWAVHQALVTVNFARGNRALTWLLGGLNYHKEHHLFPLVCHVNYPAISPIVEETCREFGVPYNTHRTFWAGLAEHYRWLKIMGSP
jgi:linoleoyl-CoA desaturase